MFYSKWRLPRRVPLKFIPSAYGDSLEGHIKRQYTEKRSVSGLHPFILSAREMHPKSLPPVESCDLMSYLVLNTSFYTEEQQ